MDAHTTGPQDPFARPPKPQRQGGGAAKWVIGCLIAGGVALVLGCAGVFGLLVWLGMQVAMPTDAEVANAFYSERAGFERLRDMMVEDSATLAGIGPDHVTAGDNRYWTYDSARGVWTEMAIPGSVYTGAEVAAGAGISEARMLEYQTLLAQVGAYDEYRLLENDGTIDWVGFTMSVADGLMDFGAKDILYIEGGAAWDDPSVVVDTDADFMSSEVLSQIDGWWYVYYYDAF